MGSQLGLLTSSPVIPVNGAFRSNVEPGGRLIADFIAEIGSGLIALSLLTELGNRDVFALG